MALSEIKGWLEVEKGTRVSQEWLEACVQWLQENEVGISTICHPLGFMLLGRRC
jgi:hypothetical protein